MAFTPPDGATLGADGFYYMPDGTMVQFGQTDAQKARDIGPTQKDPSTGLTFRMVDGQRWYDPPDSGAGPDSGASIFHNRKQWNPQTAQYDQSINWGNILSMVAAGIITAGAADALLASTPELASTAPAGASASEAAPAATAALPEAGAAAETGAAADAAVGGADAAVDGAASWDAAGNFIGPATDVTESTVAGSGLPGGLGTWADRMAALARGANAVGTAVTGQDPALAGVGAANAAQQAARNRFLAAGTDQGGPAADKTSLSNMRLAGLISNFHDTPATQFGNPAINIGDSARDYASRFQKEILARQAAGKSATTFGVPDPTPQELADEEAARRASQGRSNVPGVGGRIIDGINTGARLAGAARTIWDLF